MSNVRQYIGARYVFKIYENTIDPSSAEWESGMTYEPLTIVTYLNSTYASKKDVPASVGDPASNPSYWVVTGAYNGQIAALQSQITLLNDTITSTVSDLNNLSSKVNNIRPLKGRIFGLISDSFADPNYSWSGWVTSLASELHAPIYNKAKSGDGFKGTNVTNFTTQLEELYNEHPECTDIILYGGNNDQSIIDDYGTIITYVNTFYDRFAQLFPNAVLHCFLSNIPNGNYNTLLSFRLQNYESARRSHVNAIFYDYINCLQIAYQAYQSVSNLHPSDNFSYWIDTFIYNCLNNGYCNFTKYTFLNPSSGVTVIGSDSNIRITNDTVTLPPIALNCNQLPAATNTLFTIGGIVQPNPNLFTYCTCLVAGKHILTAEFNLHNGNIIIYGLNTIPDLTGTYSIIIYPNTIKLPW